jgi:hypothetical protein
LQQATIFELEAGKSLRHPSPFEREKDSFETNEAEIIPGQMLLPQWFASTLAWPIV